MPHPPLLLDVLGGRQFLRASAADFHHRAPDPPPGILRVLLLGNLGVEAFGMEFYSVSKPLPQAAGLVVLFLCSILWRNRRKMKLPNAQTAMLAKEQMWADRGQDTPRLVTAYPHVE